ncbi:MAG TPA: MASE1 domain-containing protein, partial [Blastocatellia bacterium]|nr:MASE1 domain-containing protein [Blastocatellia bacterium]
LLWLIATAAVYVAAARLGLSLAFLHASVSPVWPPTGIAVAAVLWLGYRISPAILLGAFLANISTGEPVATAAGVAIGNTLEALSAGFLVRRFVGFHSPFYRAGDVLKFVLISVFITPTVSATIGNASLCLGGAATWSDFGWLWLTWWIGDGVGALVVAPLLLTWVEKANDPLTPGRLSEGLFLLILLSAALAIVFRDPLSSNFVNLALSRLIVPFLLWAAFRLGPRGVATAITLFSGMAIWGTSVGFSPIAGHSPNSSLLLLQVTIATTGITFLILAGVIAERKAAEQSLSFLASIVESSDDAVIGKTLDGTILSWNGGAERLYGYTAQEMIGQPVSMLFPAGSVDELSRIFDHMKRGDYIDHYETARVRKDGRVVFVALTLSPIRDSGGRVIGASAIETDITARREEERRMAGHLAVTRILAESSTVADATTRVLRIICEAFGWELGAMWILDPGADVLRCQKVWRGPSAHSGKFESICYERTFSLGVGLPGRVWASLKPAWIPDVTSDDNSPRAPFAAREGLRAAFGFPILSGERALGVIEFFSHEIREPDDRLLAMVAGIGSQIGQFLEQKRAEEALRQSEEQLRLALEAANMGVWDYDVRTGTVKWSSSLEVIHGLAPGRFGGTIDDYMKDIHPEDREYVVASLGHSVDQGVAHRIEYRIIRPDGAIRWVEGMGEVLRDENGKAFRLTGVCMDITDRKWAEREREQLLGREQEARAEAEAANRAKDEFLALVSHELRTPLNSIAGWLDILLTNPERDETQIARALEVIKRNAALQARIIEDLLDVSRIVSGKLQLDTRPVELATIIQAAIAAVQLTADEKNVRIRQLLDRSTDPVLGDPYRLQQIVWNLLSNAIKFSPEGGEVEIRLEQAGSYARVTVRDTGEGIRPEFLPRIFDRFTQADASTTRPYGGLGLGLAIVRHLVDLHGGTVEASSEGEKQGAVFTVTLPCAFARVESHVASISEPDRDGRYDGDAPLAGLRVLIVDDDLDSREVLASLLALRAAEVRSAGSVAEALEALADWKPHVLVSDIGMPGRDGYDLIKEVRSRDSEHGGQIPAIALTGYATVQDGERALSAGYHSHMAKPVEPRHLVKLIASFGEGSDTSSA